MPLNMLVVDDSLPMRMIIIKTIIASGYKKADFFEAANGIEAIDLLNNEWMDIVITDYNMPDMDGMTLLSEMKKNADHASIPVLIITTEGSKKKVEEFLEHGAAGYIHKPFTPESIRQKLIEILGEIENDGKNENSHEDFDF